MGMPTGAVAMLNRVIMVRNMSSPPSPIIANARTIETTPTSNVLIRPTATSSRWLASGRISRR